jgi:uncharacterized OsmC-like protein
MSVQGTKVGNATVNGVTVGRVLDVIGAIDEDPENARFQFRLDNRWKDAGLNSSRIQGYYAVGREDDTRGEPFVVAADEPEITSGGDSAPNPMEFVLHSLASCLTSTMVYHAAVQGIEIESVESSLEGDMDVRGMLGLSEEVRKGYEAVRVRMRVKSEASAEKLEELALFSPVYDIVSRSVPVEFVLEKI